VAEPPRECRARVVSTRALSPVVREVDVQMEDPPELAFAAGQWISVPFGPKVVRAYSIASPPRFTRRIALCADIGPGGIGSRWFTALSPGDRVTFKGPLGGFVFARQDLRPPVFVAEEIGIVPVRSILTELYETGIGRPVTLVYGGRARDALVYDSEFRSLARRYPAFSYVAVVAQHDPGWHGETGDVVDALARVAMGARIAYVSGSGAMIGKARELLMARGLDRKSIKWERFW
jgi:NAD(P)H-flavin reductase